MGCNKTSQPCRAEIARRRRKPTPCSSLTQPRPHRSASWHIDPSECAPCMGTQWDRHYGRSRSLDEQWLGRLVLQTTTRRKLVDSSTPAAIREERRFLKVPVKRSVLGANSPLPPADSLKEGSNLELCKLMAHCRRFMVP